jgi:hypothetical protein
MSPRRIVFILVLVLWAVTGSLWAWVQFTPPPPPPPTQTQMMVYCEKKDVPKKIAKALEEAKLPFELRQNQPWKHKVQEGFLVINTIPSESTRKALFAGMKSLMPVKIVGEDIRLGGAYKTRQDAVKAQKMAKVKGFEFEIIDNIVDKTTKVPMIELGPLDPDQLKLAEQTLEKFHLKEEQIDSKTLEPAAPGSSATPK